ncbi:MAG TPA: Gfo/Idh/MocA family oxidoreductase [Gemmatimonadaceae bacterium]|nr:Gfo/Idh/MocA family oxidoreductase [Gemmatimonadaceae bacterium]
MMPPVRVGVVGAGAIAQVAHLPALARSRSVQLVALCDNDGPKASALGERFGVHDVYTDIEDLLESAELDAVVLTTPNHLHEPHVLSALAAGVHVLCERPLALSSRGVERILAAAARTDRMVAVANNHRFRSDVQALGSFLRGGELGKLNGIRAGHHELRQTREGWRYRRAESGGGAFVDLGLPLLDLALWLGDYPDPVRVSAHMERARGAAAVDEALLAFIECASGMTITIDVSWSFVGLESRWWFDAVATRGSARLSPLHVVKELNGTPADVTPRGASTRDSAFVQSYRAELAHFAAMIHGETPYEAPADQLVLHRLAEAVYKSADEQKEVRL